MKKNYSIILLLTLIITSVCGCSDDNEKIPITTSSAEARELYLKGRSLAERLRTVEALKVFEDAVMVDSNFAMAYYQLALTSNSTSDFTKYFNKAASLVDSVSEGERLFINAFKAGNIDNDSDKMLSLLKNLIEKYPNDERAHAALGNFYYGRQEYQNAIGEFNTVLKINPKFSNGYNMLGYSYRFMKNYNQAEAMFKAYTDLIPNDPNPYDSYAELLMEMGEFDRSIEMYRKALSINPYFFFSHVGIAANYDYKGEYIKSRAQLQELLRTAKRSSQRRLAHNAMAMSYYDEGNVKLAIQELHHQMQIAIDEADTAQIGFDLYLIGTVYYEAGEYPQAKELYRQANELMENSGIPDNLKRNNKYNFYYNSAMLAIKQGDMAVAKENIDAYSTIVKTTGNPNQERLVHFLRGMYAFHNDEFERAESEYRQANQQSPYVLYQLGQVFEATGHSDKALSYYNKAAHAYLANSFAYIFVRQKALNKIKALNELNS